jgi:hypothetical protein
MESVSAARLHAHQVARSGNSMMIAHYERAGEIKIGGPALDSPSDRERAHQERIKREG